MSIINQAKALLWIVTEHQIAGVGNFAYDVVIRGRLFTPTGRQIMHIKGMVHELNATESAIGRGYMKSKIQSAHAAMDKPVKLPKAFRF